MDKQPIKSLRDLRVYQNFYKAMLIVLKDVVPKLPKEEKFDLSDQMRRCCKAGPAILAEGFAKRYQPKNWQKYIDDTIGECNEMTNHLSVCVDAYPTCVNPETCKELIDVYDISLKQLYNLRKVWRDFHKLN